MLRIIEKTDPNTDRWVWNTMNNRILYQGKGVLPDDLKKLTLRDFFYADKRRVSIPHCIYRNSVKEGDMTIHDYHWLSEFVTSCGKTCNKKLYKANGTDMFIIQNRL